MAGTFTQLYIHIVFGVKYRQKLIAPTWKIELYQYINGIIRQRHHKPININGTADHIHILIGLQPNQSLSDLVREIKNNSSKWINEKKLVSGKFYWQGGYGAFTYAHEQLERVYHYIENQELHHQQKKFQDEYIEMLDAWHISYDRRYILDDDLS